jgi:methyltransferase (TIGR00027 family)
MEPLDAVSETALITLRARVLEAQRDPPLLADPVAVDLLSRLVARLPAEMVERLLSRRLPSQLSAHIALRSRQYDRYVQQFRRAHPDALVVNLGAGFDTRYFRVSGSPWPYLEVDLPEVVALKRELLGERAAYEMLPGSVLAADWLQEVQARQTTHVLLLAEGLFMYLPPEEVVSLFGRFAAAFTDSELVCEMVHVRYTRGLWKKAVARKMRRRAGTREEATFEFGVQRAQEIETYAAALRVIDEWSFFEEPDIRPGFLRLFRGWRLFTRSQWTIRVAIGQDPPLAGKP